MIGRTNTGGGGSGGTLTVTATAGVTVSVSKDGKVKTTTANAEGLAVFKGLETGTWTVTITDGVQTATSTVEIVTNYVAEMSFNRYLFDNGDDFKNLTGGWSKSGYTISGFNREDNSKVTIGNTIVCQAVSGSTTDYGGACGTANKINKDGFTKLRVKGSVSGYNSNARLYVGVNTSKTLNASPTAKISLTANGNFDKTLNLPSTTSFYVFVLAGCYDATEAQYTASLTVNSISLE